jgi:hypothetical protein
MIGDGELSDLTRVICERLPRELRDEIYGHIWDKDAVYFYGKSSRVQSSSTIIKKTPPSPRFLDHDVVGRQFATGTFEWFFSNARNI